MFVIHSAETTFSPSSDTRNKIIPRFLSVQKMNAISLLLEITISVVPFPELNYFKLMHISSTVEAAFSPH